LKLRPGRHARGKGGTGRRDEREHARARRGFRVARNLNEDGAVRAAVSLLTLAFFAPIATGCISNEYLIPRQELVRLTTIPPEVRGQEVRVVQELGSRRAHPVPTDGPGWPNDDPWPQPAPPPPEETRDTDVDLGGGPNVNIWIDGGHVPPSAPSGWNGRPRPIGRTTAADGSWRGSGPSGGSIRGGGSGWRGSPAGGGVGSSGWKGAPAPSGSGSGGSGKWDLGSGGGSGGGGGGEAMIILAVVLVAVAVIAGVSLVMSEGVRFDGVAQMSPWQPVHLKQPRGDDLVIALGDLTPVAIAGAVEAKVMDDEGFGIRELHHLPIGRRWAATFKLDGGSMTFSRGGSVQSGFIANMQFGVFVRPWLGFLMTAGLGGAADEFGSTITRHNFGFEIQSLPLHLGPLRAGPYVNIGSAALASTATGSGDVEWGKAIGGGLLTELEVTGRMALTLRIGANEAFLANSGATSAAATITGGIAIY
jgi:hypothetical protein